MPRVEALMEETVEAGGEGGRLALDSVGLDVATERILHLGSFEGGYRLVDRG